MYDDSKLLYWNLNYCDQIFGLLNVRWVKEILSLSEKICELWKMPILWLCEYTVVMLDKLFLTPGANICDFNKQARVESKMFNFIYSYINFCEIFFAKTKILRNVRKHIFPNLNNHKICLIVIKSLVFIPLLNFIEF